jgi:hypothetical protein
MDARAAVAARNNAEWCDAVCRAHGITTSFDPNSWVALRRSPPMYPDAVTLNEYASAGDVLRRVDGSPGCSIKDSFGSLDFARDSFRLLFDAEWIHREPSQHRAGHGLAWSVVRTPDELVAWGAAHGGGEVFGPVLLDDPAVTILMARDGQGVSAGAIGYRSRSVVGVSNLFTTTADIDQAWAGAIAVISAQDPDLPLVGYENGASLRAARSAGFVSVGSLRVWLKG